MPKKTNITYAFDWPGAPEQLKLAKLNGQMSATIRDGRIIELSKETEEKLGLGRLLSVLSLQTIPSGFGRLMIRSFKSDVMLISSKSVVSSVILILLFQKS